MPGGYRIHAEQSIQEWLYFVEETPPFLGGKCASEKKSFELIKLGNQPFADRVEDDLIGIMQVQFFHDMRTMRIHGAGADV